MKNYLAMISVLFLLSACETNQQDEAAVKAQAKEDINTAQGNAEHHITRVANNVRDQIKKTSMHMRDWWLTPLPPQIPTPVPPGYCYRVFQDIICYRAPMPGMEHQLVGYQGDQVIPPQVLQTKPLPAMRIQKQAENMTGAARVANSKPVFVSIPTPVKEEKNNNQSLDGSVAVGNEPLPDPALSPQL